MRILKCNLSSIAAMVIGLTLTYSAEAKEGNAADTFSREAQAPPSPLALWYRRPADRWKDALPVGNGRLGAMVYGGVSRERICLNEISLWSGAPIEAPPQHELTDQTAEVRRLLFAGKNAEAEELYWKFIEPSSGLHASHFGNSEILGALDIQSAGDRTRAGHGRNPYVTRGRPVHSRSTLAGRNRIRKCYQVGASTV